MSVLDPDLHARLIEEMDEVARTAGIPKAYIQRSMKDFCEKDEIEYVRDYHTLAERGVYGLAYVGTDYTERMMSMCGAFTRNFVLAQMFTLNELLDNLKDGRRPNASVLMIPSMHRKGGLTQYGLNSLWDLLEQRMIDQKQTVVGIGSMSGLKSDYGESFAQLVTNHYVRVAV